MKNRIKLLLSLWVVIAFESCHPFGSSNVDSEHLANSSGKASSSATLSSLKISLSSASIAKGVSATASLKGVYSDGSEQAISSGMTWTSENSTIATISATGSVLGKSIGTTNINVSYQNLSASSALTVSAAIPSQLSVTAAANSVAVSLTDQLSATVTMSDGTTQDVTQLTTWTSQSAANATVSNSAGSRGLVTGVSTGSVTVSAAYSTLTANTDLTITPWLPSFISDNRLWLDADDLTQLYQNSALTTPVASNNDPVGGWKDKSGNNFHFTQATGGARPTYLTNQSATNKSCLNFDGISQTMTNSTLLGLADGDPRTFAVVGKINNTANQRDSFFCQDVNGASWQYFCFDTRTYPNYNPFFGLYTSGVALETNRALDTNYHVFYMSFSTTANAQVITTSTTYRVDQVGTTISVQAGTDAFTSYPLTAQTTYIGKFWTIFANIKLCEVLVYGTQPSTSDRSLIENYLKTKWGTP